MLRRLIRAGVVLVGDAIDELATGESREDLFRRLRDSATRGAELALENARLKDALNAVRFKSPTLWRDEVEAIDFVLNESGATAGQHVKVLQGLVGRCELAGMTRDEFNAQFEGVLRGTADCVWDPSDEWSADVDSEEWGHFNPPPGYAVCTREWPHDGPCAHPFK